ncbi:MAG: adenosylcobinamide-phosphate synthase [Pseudohongiellaceae bacterium]|jgi:adenosylcobinamide-phosphate synthase
MWLLTSILGALMIDRVLGEPKKFHPLIGWGRYVILLERLMNNDKRWQGFWAWLFAVLPPLFIVLSVFIYLHHHQYDIVQWLLTTLCLYVALGWQSLREHAVDVEQALNIDLVSGRQAVARIVSRDTDSMDENAVARSTIESVLENGCDAIFAVLFWFSFAVILLGPVAGTVVVVAYRMVNTLDAMWGYRTPRFNHFGWFSAKADDVLNYIPAKLTAMTYAVMGEFTKALRCWFQQAKYCVSPNGGPVMCAGAGSLGLLLGGPNQYHGEWINKPVMGVGHPPTRQDIGRAIALVDRSVYCWLLLLVIVVMLVSEGYRFA